MKKLLLLSFFIFIFSESQAQWVTIPDANFVAWLQTNYPTCMNINQLDTTCSGIVNENYLDCSGQNIFDLDGIQYFNSLNTLWCNNNSITVLPPSTTNLSELNCSHNNISGSLYLSSCGFLDCSYNQISSVEIGNLGGWCCNAQFYIDCSNNQVIDFSIPYSVFNGAGNYYDVINCSNNPLDCFPKIESCSTLNFLNTNITCLSNYPQVTTSTPSLASIPLCNIFYNPNNCDIGWNIQGQVFLDGDSSCATTTDSTGISMIKMNLYDLGGNLLHQVITNWGVYSFDTQLGDYSTSVDTVNLPFNVLCPSNNSIASNLTAIDSMDYNVDFRLVCKPGFDIGVWNIYRNVPTLFPGNTTPIHVIGGDVAQSIYNIGCSSVINGEVKIVINGPANYLSPVAGALNPTVNGDTLIYTIADFSLVNAATDFAFNVITDTTALIGEQICFDVTITPTTGDNNISNNTLTHCFVVGNSFDPNEKEVSPVGSLAYPFNDWLTYTIHFQNTGTAAAQHIQLLDTLDADIDASTFQLLSYSHTPMVQITGSNVAFNFVNINLPDSTTDLAGSQGYVSYRVMPMTNLPMGTVIENTASIYFDFNAPVVTNTVSNLICNPTTATTTETICEGDTYFFYGNNLTVAGNYSYTMQSVIGCDSIINLNLIVDPVVSSSIGASICSGITFDFNGQQLSVAGNYADTLTAATGCDSIVNLSLTFLNPISSSINQTICFGDSINFNGVYFDTTGIYTDTLSNSNGCDSIVNLTLTVLGLTTSSFNQTICIGETYLFNGINETATGIYYDTLNAVNSCDSVISLHLTVNNPNATISLTGNTLTATGTGIIQWINCDSGTFVPGVIGGTFTPTVIGNYAAWIWDGLCSDTTNCVEVLLDGINQLTIDNLQFTIFPNPTDESVTAELSHSCGNCRIEICNTLGQVLYTEIIKDKVESINIAALPTGIYFVSVRSDEFYLVKKLVKH